MAHSNGSGSAYLAADVRPDLVTAIVGVEPKSPPFATSTTLGSSVTRYGVFQAPITHGPPVMHPDMDSVRAMKKANGPGLKDAVLQADSPFQRKLVNMIHIAMLVLTAQASYHA